MRQEEFSLGIKSFYEIVEKVIEDNYEMFSILSEDIDMKNNYAEELFEEYKNNGSIEIISTFKYLKANMITNQEYAEQEYGVDEETFNQFVLISKDLGWDLKNELLERADDIQIYNMEEREFVTYMLEELQILGEIPEKALNFIDTNHVWESLLRFDFSEVPNVGYVYTSL